MRSGTTALICRPLNSHSTPTIFSCLPCDITPCIQYIFVNPSKWARDKSTIWMDGCVGTQSWIGELTLILLTSRWLIPICVLIRQWVFCVRLRTTLTLNLWFGICTASRSSPLITVGDHQPTYCMCKCMHFSELEWFHNLTASNLSHLRVCSFHGYENDIATWGIACSGNNWPRIHWGSSSSFPQEA